MEIGIDKKSTVKKIVQVIDTTNKKRLIVITTLKAGKKYLEVYEGFTGHFRSWQLIAENVRIMYSCGKKR